MEIALYARVYPAFYNVPCHSINRLILHYDYERDTFCDASIIVLNSLISDKTYTCYTGNEYRTIPNFLNFILKKRF